MAENGNILRSLKEQADIHAKKFSTVFNQIDSIQVSLRKTEKETSFWRERGKRNQLYLMAPSYSSSLTTAPAKLWQKRIDAYLIYPAILKVTYKGVKMSFNSAEEAKEALKVTVLADGEDDA